MVSFLPLPTTSGLGDAASSAANSAASAAAASAANAAASAENAAQNAAQNAANSVDPSQLEQEAYEAAASAFFKTDLGKALKAAIEGAAGGAAAATAAITALMVGPLSTLTATVLSSVGAGALVGSVVPLLGTAIGAMVGALVAVAETFPPGEHGTWGGKPVPNLTWNYLGGSKGAQAVADDAVSKIRAKVPPDQWPLLRMWLYSGGSTSVPGDGSIFEELVSKGLGIPPTEATADHLVSIAIAQRAFGDHSHESYQRAVETAYTAAANDGMDILERVRILMPAYGHIAGETLANNAKGPSPVNFPPARLGSVPLIPRGVTVPRMTPIATPPVNTASGSSFGPAPGTFAPGGAFSAPSPFGLGMSVSLLPVAHTIVSNATNGTGATQASAGTTILNATSAAKGPNPTPAQTALADALALAQKIHVHAQYVQKWFGPAEAAKYFNATYITAKDLG